MTSTFPFHLYLYSSLLKIIITDGHDHFWEQYTQRQFRSAHAQNTQTIQSYPSWISSKDFLLDKTMTYTYTVNNCSNGSYWLKNCLVNMDAFTQTNNVAVTLLSGKYSYLDRTETKVDG